ncbi:transcriptional regulator, AraC family [Hymenobacter gelipurpurascens]|uniref:Transcriptional regulator, AraC family n=1 Tax=Hymenobacter gelipurpurascens TaxID=89968 RepID=A0A212THV6_9BACT|nr:AraC family transcriptional regulator [Hymenobacter gelipurpurascens]SNC65406.1 transcriptional regulator, AraC family [Hymenobacter gelipurpurascens]
MLTTDEFLVELDTIDSRPETMFVLQQHSEENYPLHQHQKTQLLYVRQGVAYLITPTKTYFLPARHYVLIPPRLTHRVLFHSNQHVITGLCFAEARDGEHPFFGTLGIYPVTDLLYEMLRYTESWYGHRGPEQYEPYLFLLNLKMVLPHISHHPLPLALPTTEDPRLVPVLRHIYEHIGELVELSTLARQFGFSPRSLSRLFQQCLSISFGQYLKLRRIMAAMALMLETKQTISEVAYAVGYNSLSSFSNTFYKLVGQRPSEFAAREQ